MEQSQLPSQEQPQSQPKALPRLNHFYHIYAGSDWLLTVHQHFVTLNAYGLMDVLENIYVGIVGAPEQRQAVIEHLQSYGNPKIVIALQEDHGNENVTLKRLWEFSKTDDGFVLFAKIGESDKSDLLTQLLRRSMTFFNIVRWQFALSELEKDGTDAVGCHYLCKEKFAEYFKLFSNENPDKLPFFFGNFWWSKSSFLKELDKPRSLNDFSPNVWLGSKGKINCTELIEGIPALSTLQNITF